MHNVFITQEINYSIYNYWNIPPDGYVDEMLQINGSFGVKTAF
jgi:hypothetical protein